MDKISVNNIICKMYKYNKFNEIVAIKIILNILVQNVL